MLKCQNENIFCEKGRWKKTHISKDYSTYTHALQYDDYYSVSNWFDFLCYRQSYEQSNAIFE